MRRLVATLAVALLTLAVLAPAALAQNHGQGLVGDVGDKAVTDAGFALIGGFPLLVFVLSLIQWRLDKRKERRKRHLPSSDWAGGW